MRVKDLSRTASDLTYSPDGLNRYTGASFTYDANGNLTSDSANTFVYDVENRLVSRSGAASATLRYDPLGRLYEVVGSTTRRFLYDRSDLIAEYDGSGTMQRRYVHGLSPGDDVLVQFFGYGTADINKRMLYADERGSAILVTDSTGERTSHSTYDEYGVRGSTNSGDFQYTGQMWLPELGMYYYKARMYSPLLGRFMQTDPIGYGDGMNMYAYVGNDPVNAIDPTGLDDYVWVPHPCPSFRNAPPPPDDKPFDGPVVEVSGTNSCGHWVPRTSGPGDDGLRGSGIGESQGKEPGYGACRYAPLSDADKKLTAEILADPRVVAAIDRAWQKTVSSGNEFGFLIYGNSGEFRPGDMHRGSPLGVRGNYLEFLGRQADGLSLPIASLHTHPGSSPNMQFPSSTDVQFFNKETGTLGIIRSTFGLTVGRTCKSTGGNKP